MLKSYVPIVGAGGAYLAGKFFPSFGSNSDFASHPGIPARMPPTRQPLLAPQISGTYLRRETFVRRSMLHFVWRWPSNLLLIRVDQATVDFAKKHV